ncbi:MAG: SPASM domain-containing protein [Candidatus Omnitrophota bacterium]|nr:SPASM domain-containing protein [Candidatus Omnitrophota bacterium]
MKPRKFCPKEILLSLTTKCNLRCAHCDIEQHPRLLSKRDALKFLTASSRIGIRRAGFTGGEPFLALDLMCAISKEAVKRGMLFGRIMTNGGWFQTGDELLSALNRLFLAGYDGDICLSISAFHCQNLKKCASFVRAAAAVWRRHDIVSIAAVKGAKDDQTRSKLAKLSRILGARLIAANGIPVAIKNENLFVRISYIGLSPVGKASGLKNGWDGRWFKDDLCKGPGNVLFVLPDGTVKPCCGYGADADILTIGSIKRDSPEELIRNARENRFISSIFSSGLHPIREHLEGLGVRFPGKTSNHCFFCHYLSETLPRPLLDRYL